MSQSETTYPLAQAAAWAGSYLADLAPYCERYQVVGSIRRKKLFVHDIEIMVISHPSVSVDMFGNSLEGTMLQDAFPHLVKSWGATVIQSGQKAKRLQMPNGITLELHLSRPESWAVETVIRTGPAEFSRKVVTPRRHGGYLPSDCRIHDGWQVFRGARNIPMDSERSFLDFLGMGWIEPQTRNEYLTPGVSVETVRP